MARAYLGLGSNLGDREANLRLALRWLEPGCRIVSVSSLYRSEALVADAAPPGPDYLNAVAAVETGLAPRDLLALAKRVEHDIGRRAAPRWAARPIDIDILLYDDVVLDTPDLTIPHPRLAQRAFVLAPLSEIAPGLIHPVLLVAIGDLAPAAHDSVERLGAPGWRRP